ncbi:glutaredoxin family protein [Marinimicrobium sp. C6131]|uniref:glutaredoxin family protein n=1 Tax=Marinimicrobium sp. C6131 TaxID=3022676 RepID=UPI00223E5CBE|nr:glutaredoxin family protein [Marinimicrobium sp. C6131]UZJ45599.1 glutaredoxin family protein [Marinimicrobium sp. C6131]
MAESALILYTTLGCHLCERAKDELWPALTQSGWRLEEVDIADSDTLMARYGTRIPVVARSDSGAELGWPFTSKEVVGLLDD